MKGSPETTTKAPSTRSQLTSDLNQVQHDTILAGGTFSILGGLLISLSLLLPWVETEGNPLGAMELLDLDLAYLTALVVPFLGAALLLLSCLSLFLINRPGMSGKKVSLTQSLVAMAASLLVILLVLLLHQEFEGQEALYGAGAFLCVIGAILAMAGSLLIQGISGLRTKPATGFKALAQRSMRPARQKEWKPPETSVKLPRCPSCHEELQPGWKACPVCGYVMSEGHEDEGRL